VPVVPGKAVSTNPNTALLPGVVVTVEELPCPIPIVTGLELLNEAVTAVAAVTVTTHVPVPLHPPPLHPANVDPSDAAAVNVTCVPLAKFAEQVVGQLIPAGALVTVPDPVPASATVNAKLFVLVLKVAVTVVAAVNVTTQVPVPVHPPPLHPANVEPSAGLAVSVTCVPLAKLAEHVDPQLIPDGLLVTVPDPVPALVTVSVKPLPELKVAVTVTSAVPIGEVQVGGFVCGLAGTQFELNPANVDPSAAVAVNITLLLSGNGARQLEGQLIPLGELVTVPVPEPASVTVRLFVPTSFSPNKASPPAPPLGEVNVVSCAPLAMLNL
jgi:phage tail protein X